MNHETVNKHRAKLAATDGVEIDVADLVVAEGKNPCPYVTPRVQRTPQRPAPGRGQHKDCLTIIGCTVLHMHETSQLDGDRTWQTWIASGHIQLRAPTVEDTLMVESAPDATELAFVCDDHEQLCLWARNEWRPQVLEVLRRRVDETESTYFRKVEAARQRDTMNVWSSR